MSDKNNTSIINFDAFSHGQMKSKLWLCEQLESQFSNLSYVDLEIYGSWYGSLVFLALIRNKLKIANVNFYDLDQSALDIAFKLHNYWRIEKSPKFSYNNIDCQTHVPRLSQESIVINTSCEHFANLNWWNNLPVGTNFALQGTDMVHVEHVSPITSLEGWMLQLKPNKVFFLGSQMTEYFEFSFTRHMLIGIK